MQCMSLPLLAQGRVDPGRTEEFFIGILTVRSLHSNGTRAVSTVLVIPSGRLTEVDDRSELFLHCAVWAVEVALNGLGGIFSVKVGRDPDSIQDSLEIDPVLIVELLPSE